MRSFREKGPEQLAHKPEEWVDWEETYCTGKRLSTEWGGVLQAKGGLRLAKMG